MTRTSVLILPFLAAVTAVSPLAAEDAAPADPATAAANLQKLQAEARKADADAAKAETDAATAKRDYRQKELPASGKSSAATVKDNAGQVEAGLLANRQLTALTAEAANRLNTRFQLGCQGATCARRKVILMGATDDLQLIHRATYELRKTLVSRALDNAISSFDTAPPPKPGKAAGFVALAAAAVVQLANLASYFAANTEVGGVAVTTNEQALYASLAENLRQVCGLNDVYIASRTSTRKAAETITTELKDLDLVVYDAAKKLAIAKTNAAALRKGKKGDAADAAAKPWDTVATNLTTAIDGYTAFTTLLADEKGAMPLSAVIREEALYQILASPNETFLVLPTYVQAGGSYYTQTSLWTLLGAVPFHVAGGSAIAYSVLRASDGLSLGGGTAEGESGYTPVKKVASELNKPKTYATIDSGNCLATPAAAAGH